MTEQQERLNRLVKKQLRQERNERKARLAHRRKLWAYEDAKLGRTYRRKRKQVNWIGELAWMAGLMGMTMFLVAIG